MTTHLGYCLDISIMQIYLDIERVDSNRPVCPLIRLALYIVV